MSPTLIINGLLFRDKTNWLSFRYLVRIVFNVRYWILYYSLYIIFLLILFHWQNWKVHCGPDVLTVFVYYILQLCSVPVTLL